eukprot:946082-Rhodomonas_salina.2
MRQNLNFVCGPVAGGAGDGLSGAVKVTAGDLGEGEGEREVPRSRQVGERGSEGGSEGRRWEAGRLMLGRENGERARGRGKRNNERGRCGGEGGRWWGESRTERGRVEGG